MNSDGAARASTTKGRKRVDLTWNVTGADSADVLRDGVFREVTADDGAWSDTSLGKAKARVWTYQICTVAV